MSLAPHGPRTGGACNPHAHSPGRRRLSTLRCAEAVYPGALALAGTPALALAETPLGAHGCGVLPLRRTWRALAHGTVQPCFGRGRAEGTPCFLGRRGPSMAFSALALTGDRASRRVWCSHIGVHLGTDITSGHATDDRRRRVPGRRKKSKNRSEGGGCLLTKGVLIRVRRAHLLASWQGLLSWSLPLASLRKP